MKHYTPEFKRRNVRAACAGLLTYMLLVGQVAPLALASNRAPVRAAAATRKADIAREGVAPALEAAPAPAPLAPAAFAPSITATKADAFPDGDGDGLALPGDTITYTVVVSNGGPDPALGVTFIDNLDTNTTLGAVNASPLARDDPYTTVGNTLLEVGIPAGVNPAVRVTTPANDSVFDNDSEYLSDTFTLSSFQASSALGGTVSMNATGNFSYLPPVNVTGTTDSFTYTIKDDGLDNIPGNADDLTSTGTVSIAIVNRVWYVNSAAAVNGDGRSTTPFNALLPTTVSGVGGLADADSAGDIIYLFSSATAYSGGIPLENNQTLIGGGVSLVVSTFTLLGAGINPTITNAAGNGVTLAFDNAIAGFNVGNSTLSAIAGSIFGTATINNIAINTNGQALSLNTGTFAGGGFASTNSTGGTNNVSLTAVAGTVNLGSGALSGATSHGLAIDGGAGSVNFSGTIGNTAARTVSVINKTGGTIALSGAVSGTGQGVFLNANTGATVNFTGGLNLNTGTNAAFTATGGGTVSATQNNAAIVNTLVTTTGTALNVANTTIGAGGLTFRSISSNGAGSGIILNNTGTTAGTTVTGNSSGLCGGQVSGFPATVTNPSAADCTGGTIQNSTGPGINLSNTRNVSFTRIRVTGGGDDGIRGSNVTTFSLASSFIENNGNAIGENGIDFGDGGGSYNSGFVGMLGTSSITNSTVTGSLENNILVRSKDTVPLEASPLNLTISGSTVRSNNTANGGDGIEFESGESSNMTLGVSSSAFIANRGQHLNALGVTNGTLNVSFTGNTCTGGNAGALGQGLTVFAASAVPGYSGSTTYDIDGNSINGAVTNAILANLGTSSAAATFTGEIRNNIIGTSGQALSCSSDANGIEIDAHGNGTHSVSITGNVIKRCYDRGILVLANDGNGALRMNVTGNTINEFTDTNNVDATPREAFHVNSGAADPNIFGLPDSHATCLNLSGNTLVGGAHKTGDIRIRQRFRTRITMPGYAGSAFDTTAVNNFLQGNNAGSTATSTANDDPGTATDGYFGGAACTTPAPFAPVSSFTGGGDEPVTTLAGGEASNNAPAMQEQPSTDGGLIGSPSFTQPLPTGLKTVAAVAPAQDAAEPHGPSRAGASRTSSGWRAPASPAASAPAPLGAGGTVNIPIGTLNMGDSVTIVFTALIDNPFTSSPKQVTNFGTVSGTNFTSVVTDDPSEGGLADPTVTLINFPDIFIRDAKVAEPANGQQVDMIFTVALSTPAPGTGVSMTYDTANGGATPATGGNCTTPDDYTIVSGGTLSFAAGEQLKTIAIPVCGDLNADPGETFLVNLTAPVGGTLVDANATGTITGPEGPGAVQITELRTSGPGGAGDDFVEVYNNSNSPLNIGATGWALVATNNGCSGNPVVVGVIPPLTSIPARGHYLFRGSQYSLADYGGTGLGAGDQTLLADLGSDVNVALFETNTLITISSANRRDAVGFGGNTGNVCDLLREGTTLPAASGSTTSQYSFVRKVTLVASDVPTPTDSNVNASDFYVVSTTPQVPVSAAIPTPVLGTPAPENFASPTIKKFSQVGAHQLDPTKLSYAEPNRVRKQCAPATPAAEECLPHRSSQGTISMRRRFVNNTGGPVTRLRFRIYLTSTFQGPSVPSGTADLRAITSGPTSATVTGIPGTVTINGTTVDMYPTQQTTDMGGGWNSSFTVPSTVISTGTPLASGGSVYVQFLFGVQQGGTFNILVHVEALP